MRKFYFVFFPLTRTWKMISITPRIIHPFEYGVYNARRAEPERENVCAKKKSDTIRLCESDGAREHIAFLHDVKCWKIILHFFIPHSLSYSHFTFFALLMSPFVSGRELECILSSSRVQCCFDQSAQWSIHKFQLHWAMNIKSFDSLVQSNNSVLPARPRGMWKGNKIALNINFA